MEAFQEAKSARLEYRQKGWVKAVNLAVVGLIPSFIIYLTFLHGGPWSVRDVILTVVILAGDAYFLVIVLRSRIVIDGTRVTVRSAFGERTADVSEIRGVRRIAGRGVSTYICLKDGSDAIELPTSVLDLDDRFREWLNQFPDLGTEGPFGYRSQGRNS
jgi:hypothetical protein